MTVENKEAHMAVIKTMEYYNMMFNIFVTHEEDATEEFTKYYNEMLYRLEMLDRIYGKKLV